jgi:hypothetical protein
VADDACTKKVKEQYDVWPSARASQAVAKCRKENGDVRKGEAGTSLKRWEDEKWQAAGGKACGDAGAGGPRSYCRPTKVVSKDTPSTARPAEQQAQKKAGGRASPQRKKS